MRVLKIVAEGLTTSFRYPHFMQQIHPSFPMPPPATIYGHICSVLGEWVDPQNIQFAYHFTHQGKVTDVEHIIVLSNAGGKLPDRSPKVLEGNVNPFEREMFFRPRLVLYLNRPEWEPAFRSPHYALALGRSQDLFTYTQVTTVDLVQAEQAYFEHTLAPHAMALQFGRGISFTMPRYLNYEQNRTPVFAQYVVLQSRVKLPPNQDELRFSHLAYGPYWTDPTAPAVDGLHLGLQFLTFV